MSNSNTYLGSLDVLKLNQEERVDALDRHYTHLRKFIEGVCDDKFHLIINGDAGMGKKCHGVKKCT